MRTVKGYKAGMEREYIPKAFGNRDDPQPIKVWICTPTEAQKREITAHGNSLSLKLGDDGTPHEDDEGNLFGVIEQTAELDRQHLAIRRHVLRVENYMKADGAPMEHGADLAVHGEDEIVIEVANEIRKMSSLDEVELKKSEGSSATSSAATQVLSGHAENAEGLNFAVSEIARDVAAPDSNTSAKEGI